MSAVSRELALYWDCNPDTATQDEVITAYARYRIQNAKPKGCGAFLVDDVTNQKLIELRQQNILQYRQPLPTKELVINLNIGLFALSDEAVNMYCQKSNSQVAPKDFLDSHMDRDLSRDDPTLIHVVRELGKAASGKNANLWIMLIHDNLKWRVEAGDDHNKDKIITWQ